MIGFINLAASEREKRALEKAGGPAPNNRNGHNDGRKKKRKTAREKKRRCRFIRRFAFLFETPRHSLLLLLLFSCLFLLLVALDIIIVSICFTSGGCGGRMEKKGAHRKGSSLFPLLSILLALQTSKRRGWCCCVSCCLRRRDGWWLICNVRFFSPPFPRLPPCTTISPSLVKLSVPNPCRLVAALLLCTHYTHVFFKASLLPSPSTLPSHQENRRSDSHPFTPAPPTSQNTSGGGGWLMKSLHVAPAAPAPCWISISR